MLLNQPQNTQTTRTPLVRRAAFTLMEMMVVVAIIIILIGISAPLVMNYWNNSKIDATKAKIQSIQTAVMKYQMDNGGQIPDINALTQVGPQGQLPVIRQQDVVDNWGQQIVIDASQTDASGRPLIYSQGPPGSGKQIRNWDLN